VAFSVVTGLIKVKGKIKDIFLVDGVVSKFFGGKWRGLWGHNFPHTHLKQKKFTLHVNYSSEGLGRTRGKPLLCTIYA
jgi:hypothetical protein